MFNQLSGDAVENVVLGRLGLGLIVLTNHPAARRALVASRAGGAAGLLVDWWHQRRPLPSPVDQLLEHSLARGWGVPHYSQVYLTKYSYLLDGSTQFHRRMLMSLAAGGRCINAE